MVNPVTSKNHLQKFIVPNCCIVFTLRYGTLIIGILQVIVGILWLVGGATSGGSGLIGIITTILMIGSGVLTIIAIKKGSVQFLWYSVYLNISIGIWLIIFVIIMLIKTYWALAIPGIINTFFIFYFAAVLRSYAFEIENTATTESTNPA